MSHGTTERIVSLDLQPRAYDICIGSGTLATLGSRLRERVKSPRAMVITDSNVGPLYAEETIASLKNAGFQAALATVPAGESSKSLRLVERLYDDLAAAKMDRGSPLIALGGGVVGDLTGFVAATWLRGIPFVQVPTTLEADVDSSVGGKTGVNHTSGKNMIGAFYQPLFVLIDTATLASLSSRDFVAGLAESVKHAVIRDAAFFDWHQREADAILAQEPNALARLIERNVQIKAEIVALDERETTGMRALLNFGHTVGHAIETAMARRNQPWRHGEAVAAGMVAAAEMSVASGRLERASAEKIISLIDRLGLPCRAPLAGARNELLTLMHADKKASAGKIRFVLAEAIGAAKLYEDIEPAWIAEGLDRVLGN